jgi:hypothetical protein
MLAALSGLMLLALGLLRLGWLANLLSHPVVSGFITASAIIIAAGQLRHTEFLDHLTGGVFLTRRDAMMALDPETTRNADTDRRISPPVFTGSPPPRWLPPGPARSTDAQAGKAG